MSSEIQTKVDLFKLANSTVYTADGSAMVMRMLWQKQKAILIFLRHFARMACRAHVDQVWKNCEQYEKSGGKIIFVGNGSASFIDQFKKDMNIANALVVTASFIITSANFSVIFPKKIIWMRSTRMSL